MRGRCEEGTLCSKVALADPVEDPLQASPLCSEVALTDSDEDSLEASLLCSKVALTDPAETSADSNHLRAMQLKSLHAFRKKVFVADTSKSNHPVQN